MTDSLILAYLCPRYISLKQAVDISNNAGSDSAAVEAIACLDHATLGITQEAVSTLHDTLPEAKAVAEAEVQWCEEHGVTILTADDPRYPVRMAPLEDAPRVLFVRGRCDFNAPHAVGMVGTRHATQYGIDWTRTFVDDMSQMCGDTIIVSGLAYGIDINAHRTAMAHGMPTVAVVAHGMSHLYPAAHRDDAARMVASGNSAVVTEFFHNERALAQHFLQRNRIIAAMSDASLIVESAYRGGGLVTIRKALDYGRDTFAVPGNVNSEKSQGCNKLIQDGNAYLTTSAGDVVETMHWQTDTEMARKRSQGIERQLFPDLTTDEQRIADLLHDADMQSNVIAQQLAMPINEVVSNLFCMEMKGLIRALPGNVFHLIR